MMILSSQLLAGAALLFANGAVSAALNSTFPLNGTMSSSGLISGDPTWDSTMLGAGEVKEDRQILCVNDDRASDSSKDPLVRECVNALLKVPSTGDVRIFTKDTRRLGEDGVEVLDPAQWTRFEKCYVVITMFLDKDEDETTWAAIRAAASDLVFTCAKGDGRNLRSARTVGSVVLGRNAGIQVEIKKVKEDKKKNSVLTSGGNITEEDDGVDLYENHLLNSSGGGLPATSRMIRR